MCSQPVSEVVVGDFLDDVEPEAVIGFLTRWVTGDAAAARNHLADHATGAGTTLVASRRGSVVGVVTVRWIPRDPSFAALNIPLVHQLAVASDVRRSGVATALMDTLERIAVQRGNLAIGVTVGLFDRYGPAQRLYVRRGYVPDGRGACRGRVPLEEGDAIQLGHDVMLWLVKDLRSDDDWSADI